MIAFICVLGFISGCLAAPCTHTNSAEHTEEQVIARVIALADHNNDGILSVTDLAAYFVINFDHNHNSEVDKNEFILQWHETFHDEKAFAEHVFTHFDTNADNVLNLSDLFALNIRLDTDGNGTVTNKELESYLQLIYNAC
ncbi:hypothetical protein LOTGIDRAFT_152847 [Lottia gigantea]|uniref:EF-hand domain-containing protein n=1 Tax=Lottia gigantea TaxID=225164 RepID=V4C7R7_LOTGI|nr:hypothetical protein LOTGIDRAFT_152847 [Lottia gigantea]ESO97754.1 hypothetical protein LOTGIDRAFT_152847 [Lottia gigantea]